MAVKPIPDGYQRVIPYLVVERVPPLIAFLQSVFDGEVLERMDAPDGRVMHAEVRVGDSIVMMAEAKEGYPPRPGTLYVYASDVDDAYRRALHAGASSLMEPADQFYGDRNAGVADASGNQWWIAARREELSPEELRARALAQG
ncbi:MAG: VOC family protein [Holophagaceae bacterium]|nr:VOC family protein [Holophagaceae bacterium]